ncbi:probable phospholipid-transporting ATPase IA isoform X2 [Folsomia candida]|uniref:probable phospholipid-transporting ATPase IA isoform X2 n=1 Tax=Folsomia candida TaxID=158441 RepID=UPI000B90605B|nr:probable phospholipid-transporting ATPase IA isoform X2 [Folsomia candida]
MSTTPPRQSTNTNEHIALVNMPLSPENSNATLHEDLHIDVPVEDDDGENTLNGSETQNDQGEDTVDGAILSRNAGDGKSRVILINKPQGEHFLTNEISTAKYSVLSFIPSFLFEQFRRYSNIFFLCIALLQQIPDVSPTGRYTTLVPLIFILSVSALKEIIEDWKRHVADRETNNREIDVLKNGQWQPVKWSNVGVGDFLKVKNNMFFPADLILYSTSEPQGICYIETSNLDGETNLKVRQGLPETAEVLDTRDLAALTGYVECELPNRHLYEFAGKLKLGNAGEELALGPDQVLLRGAKLQNTNWVFGQVVYTGHETKLLKNSTAAPLKRSTVDKLTNNQIIMLFILLILVSVMSAIFSLVLIDEEKIWYLPPSKGGISGVKGKILKFFQSALTFLILYNNLIPISLTVTLEVVRFIQAMFINMDRDMYCAETDTPAMARTSNLNEELGQVRYVFSDKTGTLTRNVMEFKGCTVGGEMYDPDFFLLDPIPLIENLRSGHKTADEIREFLVLLSVCHTVIPEHTETEVVYHAASPDERALVYGASKLGYVFNTRTPSYVEISALGVTERYEVLNALEFTSTRKRMSVIVKAPNGKIRLFCKGADTVIYERLAAHGNSESNKQKTREHLEIFATQGLRTLCVAAADISPHAYEDWRKIYHKASTAIQNRELKLEEASNLIERNLILLGATAIEDKLQDKVPETIAALIKAGISVWVLTGDKQETAINIGYSSRLLSQSMELLIVNQESLDATRECILGYIHALSRDNSHVLPKENEAAVIIDGKSLTYALSCDLRRDFIDLCCSCKSVIVCRASPIQKAEIVEYVTHQTGEVTLAIGDGANDVAMIQKAHVGVGISGVEGLQAATASDYAIAQFHFLAKLLFVHGAWNYDRMCKLIFYSFYKNICLYIIELWFAIYSAWSGQVIFERWTIGFYNMLFTSAQPIAMGIFERQCSQDIRMKFPVLYRQNKDAFNLKTFFMWVGNSIVHSIFLFWLSYWAMGDGIVWGHGAEGGYLVLGNFIYTYVVIVVSLKAGLETKSWTLFTHLAIWGSIVIWVLFLIIYSLVWRTLPIGAEIFGIGFMVFTSPVFWVGVILIPVATLLPDVIMKAVQNTMFQSLDDQFRECEVLQRDPSAILSNEKHRLNNNKFDEQVSVASCLLRLSETARLLRNVRNVFRRATSNNGHELELSHGYAFSQEEHGVVTQSQLIRSYDTTIPKPEGM